MADLFNLDAEINTEEDPQENQAEIQGEEWNDQDAEQVDAETETQETTATPKTSLPERVDLEDISARTTTDGRDYKHLYYAWVQECRSPEILPFPTELVDRVRERIEQAGDEETAPQTGNKGLDALIKSLLTIDIDRLSFILADLLKRRLQKIQAHPFHMSTKTDCMSPHEEAFWKEYEALLQQHQYKTVTQHFPNRDNWRTIPCGTLDIDHIYCFAYCIEDIKINHGDEDRPYVAGSRIIVRYNKADSSLLQSSTWSAGTFEQVKDSWFCIEKMFRRYVRPFLSGNAIELADYMIHRINTSLNSRRSFQTLASYDKWKTRVQNSRLKDSTQELQLLNLRDQAPFLYSVSPMADHLELHGLPDAAIGSPRASLLQCRYPLENDDLLRNSVSDLTNWSAFRLGKFYETVDALTADVAYRHCASQPEVTFVTAGHYHSRKVKRTDIQRDVYLRSYITSVGSSSMEVRTDALQRSVHDDSKDELVNVCHTIMVAMDKSTMKSVSKSGKKIQPLLLDPEALDERERFVLAETHQEIRRKRSQSALQLRFPTSSPPVASEMQELHRLHQKQTSMSSEGKYTPHVGDFTFRSSTVIFPENRNVHGKLFGGFVMGEAHNLAQYTATCFSKGRPIVPLGIDEAIFLQPISIGDLVTFTARLVHSTNKTCRALVIVEVRDPADTSLVPLRSNRLMFVFGGSSFESVVLPDRYGEMLMHIDARRRHEVEGPKESDVTDILKEMEDIVQ